jgi:hypothetical protein
MGTEQVHVSYNAQTLLNTHATCAISNGAQNKKKNPRNFI